MFWRRVDVVAAVDKVCNKKLWFVSAIKARGCTLQSTDTYVPNYTRSRDHASDHSHT